MFVWIDGCFDGWKGGLIFEQMDESFNKNILMATHSVI